MDGGLFLDGLGLRGQRIANQGAAVVRHQRVLHPQLLELQPNNKDPRFKEMHNNNDKDVV
jgi:hypothetical protein